MLSLKDIGMVFPDGTEALRSVSVDINRGDFIGLVGPSGCGKSTLLRIASGLLASTSGTVRSEGADVGGIGYVFQDPTLLPWRTVAKNVELFAELHGVPKPKKKKNAGQWHRQLLIWWV